MDVKWSISSLRSRLSNWTFRVEINHCKRLNLLGKASKLSKCSRVATSVSHSFSRPMFNNPIHPMGDASKQEQWEKCDPKRTMSVLFIQVRMWAKQSHPSLWRSESIFQLIGSEETNVSLSDSSTTNVDQITQQFNFAFDRFRRHEAKELLQRDVCTTFGALATEAERLNHCEYRWSEKENRLIRQNIFGLPISRSLSLQCAD